MKKVFEYKILWFVVPVVLLLEACSREIDIELGSYEKKVVIEAYIERGAYPTCVLSYNQDYFGEIDLSMMDFSQLESIFIQKDTVIVSDGVVFDTLKFEIDPLILQGKTVWPPARYIGSKIKGEEGKSYQLEVLHEGQRYTATTSIQQHYRVDTLWFELLPGNDTLGSIYTVITDNPNETNYYRYFTKRMGRDYYYTPGSMSIWDDRFFNGQEFEFVLWRGRSIEQDYGSSDPEAGYFKVGDTVSIKSSMMDHDSFWFWQTLGDQKTLSNIKGGALGVWCGYGTAYDTIVCKIR